MIMFQFEMFKMNAILFEINMLLFEMMIWCAEESGLLTKLHQRFTLITMALKMKSTDYRKAFHHSYEIKRNMKNHEIKCNNKSYNSVTFAHKKTHVSY